MGEKPSRPVRDDGLQGRHANQAHWDGDRWTGRIRFATVSNPIMRRVLLIGPLATGLLILSIVTGCGGLPDGVLIDEDFSDADDLPFLLENDRFIDMAVDGGEYLVTINDPNAPHVIRNIFDRSSGSLAFETTLETTFDPDDRLLTSIGCWNADAGYVFVVLPSGEAGLLEVVSEKTGERIPLSELVSVEGFESGEPTRLELDCVGGGTEPTTISAWINDTPILSVSVNDGMDSFNAIGFWLGAEGTTFHIDHVLVKEGPVDVPLDAVPRVTHRGEG